MEHTAIYFAFFVNPVAHFIGENTAVARYSGRNYLRLTAFRPGRRWNQTDSFCDFQREAFGLPKETY